MSETNAPAPWVNHWYIVLPNPSCPAIAMLPTAAGWALPYMRDENETWLPNSAGIAAALRRELGLSGAFTILRYLSMENHEDQGWARFLFVLEPGATQADDPATPLPPGTVWVSEADLALLPLAQPEQRAALLGYFAERRTGAIPATRAPWARVGWFAAAAAWIEQSLGELGYTMTGPVEQRRNWSISSVLAAPTTTGTVYFKVAAQLPLFVNEAVMTATLARLFPAHVLPPLRIDPARRWMLMEDFGPPLRKQSGSDFAPALTLYGALQRHSAAHLADLQAAGAHDRRLEVLAGQIDPVLAHPITQAHVPPDDLAALRGYADTLKARCAEVAGAGLPATLLHGDLNLGNIAQRHGATLFFDWTDACIGHPFLDLFEVYYFTANTTEHARLRDAYLAAWTDFAPPARLYENWVRATPLVGMHQAVSYLSIAEHIDPLRQGEMIDGLPHFLRQALTALRAEEEQGVRIQE